MEENTLTKSQKLVWDISGYNPLEENDGWGAKNDDYYKCNDEIVKRDYLFQHAIIHLGWTPSGEQMDKIITYLDGDFNNSNDWFYAFKELK